MTLIKLYLFRLKSGTKNSEFDKIINASTSLLQKDSVPRRPINFDQKIESKNEYSNDMFNDRTYEWVRKVQCDESVKRPSFDSCNFQSGGIDSNKYIFDI